MKKLFISLLVFVAAPTFLWSAELGDDLSSLDRDLGEIDSRLASEFDVSADQISQETDAISDLDQKVNQLGEQADGAASGLLDIDNMSKEDLLVYRKKLMTEREQRFSDTGPRELPTNNPVDVHRDPEALPNDPVPEGAERPVQELEEQVEVVENELVNAAEGEVDHEGVAEVKNAESSALQETEGNFLQKAGGAIKKWANKGSEEIKSLNLSIKDVQSDINVLKEQIERRTSLVTKIDGTVSERFIADKPGAFGSLSKDQKAVLKDGLKDGLKTAPEGVSASYSLKTNPDGSITIEATIKDTNFTHTIKNPTAMEQDLLKGEPSLTINKDGIMTFSKKDLKLAQSVNEETAGLKSTLSEKQEVLNQSLSKINKVEGPLNKLSRWWDNFKCGSMRSMVVKLYNL